MIRASLRIAMAAALVGIGWVVGVAQTSQPDFELLINAPSGETRIECVRGCTLSWVERGLNSNAEASSKIHVRLRRRALLIREGWWLDQQALDRPSRLAAAATSVSYSRS